MGKYRYINKNFNVALMMQNVSTVLPKMVACASSRAGKANHS